MSVDLNQWCLLCWRKLCQFLTNHCLSLHLYTEGKCHTWSVRNKWTPRRLMIELMAELCVVRMNKRISLFQGVTRYIFEKQLQIWLVLKHATSRFDHFVLTWLNIWSFVFITEYQTEPLSFFSSVSSFRLTDLSGSLTDGPVNYKYKTKCTWLIEGL